MRQAGTRWSRDSDRRLLIEFESELTADLPHALLFSLRLRVDLLRAVARDLREEIKSSRSSLHLLI